MKPESENEPADRINELDTADVEFMKDNWITYKQQIYNLIHTTIYLFSDENFSVILGEMLLI